MTIQEQIQIVEANLNEYGQCNITSEEFIYLKQQIRAEAIDEFLNEVEEWGSYCVFHRYDDFCEMHKIMKKVAEQLKENK